MVGQSDTSEKNKNDDIKPTMKVMSVCATMLTMTSIFNKNILRNYSKMGENTSNPAATWHHDCDRVCILS